jgi:hypothetical protein
MRGGEAPRNDSPRIDSPSHTLQSPSQEIYILSKEIHCPITPPNPKHISHHIQPYTF